MADFDEIKYWLKNNVFSASREITRLPDKDLKGELQARKMFSQAIQTILVHNHIHEILK